MAAKFYPITKEEMDQFMELQGFTPVPVPHTFELVYGKRVDQVSPANGMKVPLTLRVYTGIDAAGGQSRGVGTDAIRLQLFTKNADGNIVSLGGSKRIHRVMGWKNNMQKAIDNWKDILPKDACNQCGMPMVPREGKYGRFLSCSGWKKDGSGCNNVKKAT